MLRGLFVTGTDTGVGKTVASAALLTRLRRDRPMRYWKPIQTGIDTDNDTRTVRVLSGCTPREIFDAGIRLPGQVSPHLAARLHGTTIHINELMTLASAQPDGECWIVEGAGGALAPINDDTLMAGFMASLGLKVVVVARSTLGTINHTLLTIEALGARALVVAGVIMVGDANRENRAAIEHYGQVAVIGEIPFLQPLTPEALQRAAVDLRSDGLLDTL